MKNCVKQTDLPFQNSALLSPLDNEGLQALELFLRDRPNSLVYSHEGKYIYTPTIFFLLSLYDCDYIWQTGKDFHSEN